MIFENLKPFYTKLKNQKIIEIESDNFLYDLHNASQFLGFNYNLEKTSLALTWLYYDDDPNNKKLLIELQCEDVMDFYISAKNKNNTFRRK